MKNIKKLTTIFILIYIISAIVVLNFNDKFLNSEVRDTVFSQQINSAVGEWRIDKLFVTTRTTYPNKSLQPIGKEFTVDKNFDLIIDNKKYYLKSVELENIEETSKHYNMIGDEVAKLGVVTTVLTFVEKLDVSPEELKYCGYTIYISNNNMLYFLNPGESGEEGIFSTTKIN